ncbi:MAG: molybdenum cofactor guanylyltransferase [Terriglobales bacterium]
MLQQVGLWMFFGEAGFVYDRRMGELSAFVLAGGQSTRMGTDKALVEFEGMTLLARALALLSTVTTDVRILGAREKFDQHGAVLEDEFPNHGPLGGIHAGLRASAADINLILAVDMPFIDGRFLKYLADEARKCNAIVTVPRAAGGWQPLCAVYRRPFADLAESALRQGKNKIDPLFRQIELRVVEETEMKQQGFSSSMFRNLNTPGELTEATGIDRTTENEQL